MSWGWECVAALKVGKPKRVFLSSTVLLQPQINNNNVTAPVCLTLEAAHLPCRRTTKNEVTPQTRLSVVLIIIKLFFFLMSGLRRWLNCKYLKIGSGAIVYYHGIHIEYFPSGNKYLFQKGNNVRLNCFQTVTHRDGECPYRSTLWRSYMTTPWLWPLDPSLALHASPSSFFYW